MKIWTCVLIISNNRSIFCFNQALWCCTVTFKCFTLKMSIQGENTYTLFLPRKLAREVLWKVSALCGVNHWEMRRQMSNTSDNTRVGGGEGRRESLLFIPHLPTGRNNVSSIAFAPNWALADRRARVMIWYQTKGFMTVEKEKSSESFFSWITCKCFKSFAFSTKM